MAAGKKAAHLKLETFELRKERIGGKQQKENQTRLKLLNFKSQSRHLRSTTLKNGNEARWQRRVKS